MTFVHVVYIGYIAVYVYAAIHTDSQQILSPNKTKVRVTAPAQSISQRMGVVYYFMLAYKDEITPVLVVSYSWLDKNE